MERVFDIAKAEDLANRMPDPKYPATTLMDACRHIRKLTRELEWFADKTNYAAEAGISDANVFCVVSRVEFEGLERAQAALARIRGTNES